MVMVSPAAGRITSGYGRREAIPGVTTIQFHAGLDIANDVWTKVHAMFAGWVKDEGKNVAPWRSGTQNVLIGNPDGEGQYYGHLISNIVKVGQWVEAGDLIGYMGANGNVTGPHLHLETWANWKDPSSHYNPMILFRKYGIRAGSEPVVNTPPPQKKEYFDMDKKEFDRGLDDAFQRNAEYMIDKFFASRIKIAGNLAKALGVKTLNVSTVLRHSAATLTELRQKYNYVRDRLDRQDKALKRIAASVVDNKAALKEIDDLLDERLPEPAEIKDLGD